MAAINLNKEQFQQMAEGGKPILVDFWAPWCGYCRRIAPAVEALADELDGRIRVAGVNVDDAPDVAARFGVNTIPTLLLFKNGEVIGSVVAPGSKAAIEAFIKETLEQ